MRGTSRYQRNCCFSFNGFLIVYKLVKRATKTLSDVCKLVEEGFDCFTEMNGIQIFRKLSEITYRYQSLEGIDALNYSIANHITSFSQRFRKTHTGTLSHNMLAVFIGIVLLTILLLFFRGHLS